MSSLNKKSISMIFKNSVLDACCCYMVVMFFIVALMVSRK